MRYPTITPGRTSELAIEFIESGHRDPSAEVVEQEIRDSGELPDLARLGDEIERERQQFLETGSEDRDRVEGRVAGIVHATLSVLPTPILDDPGFWSFLSLAHCWPFVVWRQEDAFHSGDPAKFMRYVDGTNATECVLLRTYLRGQISHTEYGYGLASALPRATDLWRSHVIRVGTGAAPVVAQAFVRDQVRERMRTDDVRAFARGLNRSSTNIVFPYLEGEDADRLIRDLKDQQR